MKFKAISDKNRQIKDTLNWTAINAYTEKWKSETWFDIEIVRRVPKKSDPMRHYYWAVVVKDYAEHLGYDIDERELLHRQLKIVFFQCKPDDKGIYRNVPSIFSNESTLPVQDKKKFVDWVVRSAARDGAYIPDPNEQ